MFFAERCRVVAGWWRMLGMGAVVMTVAACGYTRTITPASMCDMEAIDSQRRLWVVPGVNGQDSPLTEPPLNSVSITDLAITNKVYVREARAKRTQAKTVEIFSNIVNCTDYPLQVEARTQFYDTGRTPSEPVSAWKRVYLDPRTSNIYRENSIGTDDANYFRVEVREGR